VTAQEALSEGLRMLQEQFGAIRPESGELEVKETKEKKKRAKAVAAEETAEKAEKAAE
jgi:hypothetical protein